jgi:hypothetical protein
MPIRKFKFIVEMVQGHVSYFEAKKPEGRVFIFTGDKYGL